MRAVQKRSVLVQVKKKLSEDATSNLCVRKPRSKSWWRRLSNISLQYRSWIKHLGHENLGNEHRLRKLWIVAQVLLIGIEGNVWRTVCKVCILMLGCKGLSQNVHKLSSSQIRYFTSLFGSLLDRFFVIHSQQSLQVWFRVYPRKYHHAPHWLGSWCRFLSQTAT